MMNFSSRAVRSTTVTTDFNSLVTTLQGVLNNSTNCPTALGVFNLNPGGAFPQTVSPIKSAGSTGSVIAQLGMNGGSLNVTNLEFASATALGATNQYLAVLHLAAKKVVGGGGAVGTPTASHDFQLIVTVDPTQSNKIIGCSGQSDTLWQKAANGVDIYYSNGNVGIGTSAPAATLDVAGGVRPGSMTTGGACSPEGAFGYDMGAHAPAYCNNSGKWAALGGSPPGTVCGFSGRDFNLATNTWGNFTSLCQGIDPLSGCPAGYTQHFSYAYGNAHFNAVWCAKN